MRIAFGFKAGAGKDYACEYLISKYGGHNLKMAGPVKELAEYIQTTLGFPVEKDRELLQWLGTDFGRKRDPEVWIRLMRQRIKETPPAHLFVSDLRFLNEAEMLKEEGFVLVKVDRATVNTPGTGDRVPSWKAHASETELEKFEGFDYVIKNCGTMPHYEGQLDLLWQKAKEEEHLINRRTVVIV